MSEDSPENKILRKDRRTFLRDIGAGIAVVGTGLIAGARWLHDSNEASELEVKNSIATGIRQAELSDQERRQAAEQAEAEFIPTWNYDYTLYNQVKADLDRQRESIRRNPSLTADYSRHLTAALRIGVVASERHLQIGKLTNYDRKFVAAISSGATSNQILDSATMVIEANRLYHQDPRTPAMQRNFDLNPKNSPDEQITLIYYYWNKMSGLFKGDRGLAYAGFKLGEDRVARSIRERFRTDERVNIFELVNRLGADPEIGRQYIRYSALALEVEPK